MYDLHGNAGGAIADCQFVPMCRDAGQNIPGYVFRLFGIADYGKLNEVWITYMRILVTNDDGIHADGLWALAEELKKVGKVTIVAPDRDQSGSGTSITLRRPLRLLKVRSHFSDVEAYSVDGTPGDSVILALRFGIKDKVDLVVSGINEGPNLGNDVFVSGTVGAALQGYFYDIPSIAVSVAAFEDVHFDAAAVIARLMARAIGDGKLNMKGILNVNLPNIPAAEVEGIEVTSMGGRNYLDNIDPGRDGKKKYLWIVRGVPEWNVVSGSDVWALEQNKISVTRFPDSLNGTGDDALKNVVADLFAELKENKLVK